MAKTKKNKSICVVPAKGCVINSKHYVCGAVIGEEGEKGALVASVEGVTKGNLVALLRTGVAQVGEVQAQAVKEPQAGGDSGVGSGDEGDKDADK